MPLPIPFHKAMLQKLKKLLFKITFISQDNCCFQEYFLLLQNSKRFYWPPWVAQT